MRIRCFSCVYWMKSLWVLGCWLDKRRNLSFFKVVMVQFPCWRQDFPNRSFCFGWWELFCSQYQGRSVQLTHCCFLVKSDKQTWLLRPIVFLGVAAAYQISVLSDPPTVVLLWQEYPPADSVVSVLEKEVQFSSQVSSRLSDPWASKITEPLLTSSVAQIT